MAKRPNSKRLHENRVISAVRVTVLCRVLDRVRNQASPEVVKRGQCAVSAPVWSSVADMLDQIVAQIGDSI